MLVGAACGGSAPTDLGRISPFETASDGIPTSSARPSDGLPAPTPAVTTSPSPAPPSPPRYVFPLDPPSAASYSQGHHDYPAIDLFAPEGTRFVAVTSGVIDEVGRQDRWNPAVDDPATRGGLFVSLVGDDGVRYYGSHLSAVAPGIQAGMHVDAGALLGFVGATGNAAGKQPHLHFGISHPTHPGDWEVRRGEIDPFPYVEAWKGGVLLPPPRFDLDEDS